MKEKREREREREKERNTHKPNPCLFQIPAFGRSFGSPTRTREFRIHCIHLVVVFWCTALYRIERIDNLLHLFNGCYIVIDKCMLLPSDDRFKSEDFVDDPASQHHVSMAISHRVCSHTRHTSKGRVTSSVLGITQFNVTYLQLIGDIESNNMTMLQYHKRQVTGHNR